MGGMGVGPLYILQFLPPHQGRSCAFPHFMPLRVSTFLLVGLSANLPFCLPAFLPLCRAEWSCGPWLERLLDWASCVWTPSTTTSRTISTCRKLKPQNQCPRFKPKTPKFNNSRSQNLKLATRNPKPDTTIAARLVYRYQQFL